jgi:hypothetical protein
MVPERARVTQELRTRVTQQLRNSGTELHSIKIMRGLAAERPRAIAVGRAPEVDRAVRALATPHGAQRTRIQGLAQAAPRMSAPRCSIGACWAAASDGSPSQTSSYYRCPYAWRLGRGPRICSRSGGCGLYHLGLNRGLRPGSAHGSPHRDRGSGRWRGHRRVLAAARTCSGLQTAVVPPPHPQPARCPVRRLGPGVRRDSWPRPHLAHRCSGRTR